MTYHDCTTCIEYADARHVDLLPEVVITAADRGIDAKYLFRHYMSGVHERHLSGLPILPERAA